MKATEIIVLRTVYCLPFIVPKQLWSEISESNLSTIITTCTLSA